MNFFSFFFLSILSLFLPQAQASDLKTSYVTFNIAAKSIELQHLETSSEPSFISLNKRSSILVFSLRVGGEKEFLADNPVSFTIGGGAGGMFGRQKDELVTQGLQYRDQASGYFYGAGATVNGNFKIFKMRSQVFGGLNLLKTVLKYKLSYEPRSSSTPSMNIDYTEDGTMSFLTAGMRFFDAKTNLFSIIAVDYEVVSSFSSKIDKAKMNKANIAVSNPATPKHNPIVASVGFGMTF